MLSLLMLGIIPGTNIQISFEAWLVAMLLFTVAAIAIFTHRRWISQLPHMLKSLRQVTQNLRATVRPA